MQDPKHEVMYEHAEQDATRETKMSVGSYLASRFTTLKPRRDKVANPFTSLRKLNREQWLFFWVCSPLNANVPSTHSFIVCVVWVGLGRKSRWKDMTEVLRG